MYKAVQFLLALSVLALVGCGSSSSSDDGAVKNIETVEDVKKAVDNLKAGVLYETVNKGSSDTVIVLLQGGPLNNLAVEMAKGLVAGAPELAAHTVVMPHQVQTKYADIFKEKEIDFEDAKILAGKSTVMARKVVKHYKDMGKKVYVVGISYGAFLAQDLIANFHSSIADGFVVSVGRLDMNEDGWKVFSRGSETEFEDDAVTLETEEKTPKEIASRNNNRLAAGLGYKRYTDLFKDENLDNVIYLNGTKDKVVGKLTDAEQSFLEGKGVQVILKEAGHEVGLSLATFEALKELMMKQAGQ